MKTALKKVFLPIFLMLFIFTACQEEVIETNQGPQNEVLAKNSTVASLMSQTSLNDGSNDNIIDSANCFNIQLPVTVIVNGLEIIIDSVEDYAVIEVIFDEFDTDNDTLDILFPITIILSDYTTVTIENQSQLESYMDLCNGENEDDDDIECIDFQYPITFEIFDSQNNQIGTATINNDQEMYEFIEDIDEDDIVNISFPITVLLSDGTSIVINNLSDLEDAIESAMDQCDEDDDNDWNDDDNNDISDSDFINLLTYCTWTVDELEVNNNDLEDQYEDYLFTFNTDETVTVEGSGMTYSGTWNLVNTSAGLHINLQIDDLPDFNNEHWILHEIENDDNEFELDFRNGEDRLKFESSECGDNPINDCTETVVEAYLMDCIWNVDELNGDDYLFEYNLEFNDSNELTITNTTTGNVIYATWSTFESTSGVVVEFSNITGVDIEDILGSWTITECEDDELYMQNNSSSDEMVLEKDCD